MSGRVSISLKSAKALMDLHGGTRDFAELRSAIARAERPRPGLEKAARERAKKQNTKKNSTEKVRKLVRKRAGLTCECGCGRWFRGFGGARTMDHFEGIARSESLETCWALRVECHEDKHADRPSKATWFGKFIDHCRKHGYAEAEVEATDALEALSVKADVKRLQEAVASADLAEVK